MTCGIADLTCRNISRNVRGPAGLDTYIERQAATTNSTSRTITLLFHSLGGRVPKVFVERAVCPQIRFDKRGEQYEITPANTALDQELIRLLVAAELKQVIEDLVSSSIISEQGATYVCRNESGQELSDQAKDYWLHQAFTFCCFVFPRNPAVESL